MSDANTGGFSLRRHVVTGAATAPRHGISMSHPSSPANAPALSPVRIGLFCLLALIAGGGVAYWLDGRTAPRFPGYLEARTTQVCATRSGLISKRIAPEGTDVTLKKPLVLLADPGLEERIEEQEELVASFEQALSRSIADAEVEIEWRQKDLAAQICEAQLRSAGYLKEKFNYELRKNMLADFLASNETAMWDDGDAPFRSMILEPRMGDTDRMNTVLRMETASNAADVSAAQVEICDQQVKQLEKIRTQLPIHIRRKVGVDAAEANLTRAKDSLTKLTARRDQLTIVSPAIGRVGVYRVNEGDRVDPGMPIVELLDDARRFLKVEVPSSEIARFTVGQNVILSFPGGAEGTGRVYTIAPQAEPRSDRAACDPTVVVHVEPTGLPWPQLPFGSRVMVRLAR
jgi:multidrug efflux pump subunit AcrA (membrane-fusion protein)